MIDKLGNINTGNTQGKRVTDDNKTKNISISESNSTKSSPDKGVADVKISSELNVKDMSSEAPINTAKVSAIKDAISKGQYPVDLDKIADALLQAYQDIK